MSMSLTSTIRVGCSGVLPNTYRFRGYRPQKNGAIAYFSCRLQVQHLAATYLVAGKEQTQHHSVGLTGTLQKSAYWEMFEPTRPLWKVPKCLYR